MQHLVVVDTSVVMAWCFEDETSTYADSVLDQLSGIAAIVPSIWPLEVINVLQVAERRNRLKPADSDCFLTLLSQLPITVDNHQLENKTREVLDLGRSVGLSSYDTSYLHLAMHHACSIATLEKKIMAAAKKLDVSLFDPLN